MISVVNPGIFSTIQDAGRLGIAHLGVPSSGAMDIYAANTGNQLLNNHVNAAVLEITFGNASFQFEKEAMICITGANFTPSINGKNITLNSVLHVSKGSLLSFGSQRFGLRSYVCVQGGFVTETVLGSKSFYKGITASGYLQKGDVLPFGNALKKRHKFNATVKVKTSHFSCKILHVTKGPEFNLLEPKQQELLFGQEFTVSNDANRVGYRLEELLPNKLAPILTSGVLPGTVQLTPSGKLIVLMRDCQVTGGYPRVLQLKAYAISKLGQKVSGETIQFCMGS